MGRPRIHPPRQPADPAHVSEVRRAAAIASANARRERSINKGVRPKSVHVRADMYDALATLAAERCENLTTTATRAIEHGIAHLRAHA